MSLRIEDMPMSRANLLICGLLGAGLIATLVLGLVSEAIGLGVALVIAVFAIYRARRPGSSDVTRVDAIEYRDERDRLIARDGFAVVGVIALVLSIVQFVLASVLVPEWAWVSIVQATILFALWAVANRAAASRH